jgi:alpha-methylacyl-CoA racemase
MGPLAGLRVVEIAGIGPAPFCAMLLADMGAEVLRIDRLATSGLGIDVPTRFDLLNRNKSSVAIDLKSAAGKQTVKRLIEKADVLIEGFRPGVMERLGFGPDECQALNARLVYGRMTGWGQEGPLSQAASHDLNYIALTGVLSAIGPKGEPPSIPLNLIGDFGGGSLYLAMGILAAVLNARQTGRGQVVDAAIVDGTASLLTLMYSYRQMGDWSLERGTNMIDGGAPFYGVYETLDGRQVAIAPVEAKFYRELLERTGIVNEDLPKQEDRARWAQLRSRLAEVFKTRTSDEWCKILEGTDACFSPVLDMDECVKHPHNVARKTYVEVDGVMNPAPAPRFSATPSELRKLPPAVGEDTDVSLADWGFSVEEVESLRSSTAIR